MPASTNRKSICHIEAVEVQNSNKAALLMVYGVFVKYDGQARKIDPPSPRAMGRTPSVTAQLGALIAIPFRSQLFKMQHKNSNKRKEQQKSCNNSLRLNCCHHLFCCCRFPGEMDRMKGSRASPQSPSPFSYSILDFSACLTYHQEEGVKKRKRVINVGRR